MNIESTKIDLAKQLFNINEEAVLMQIKTILDKKEIVAYTTDGIPLTRKEYIKAITEADKDVENGNYISQDQLLENIKKW
jgi:hypothetical protein